MRPWRRLRAAFAVLLPLYSALDLIELHGADGQIVYLNAVEISSLRAPTKSDLSHYFPKHVQCIVVTTNGKFYAARESCPAIRDRLIKEGG